MFEFLHGLLSDKKGGEIFTVFGFWHFVYIFAALALIAALLGALRKKEQKKKERAAGTLIDIAFGLYVADFFLMPLSYGEIDIEKLPFHICTAMCVMCFLSEHIPALKKLRLHFVLLGFISNLVYLIYPAGVMWHAVHPLCYRVIQTLLFHGIMTSYGFLTLYYNKDRLTLRGWFKDLAVTVAMTLWALLGNYVYNGKADGYDHFFNWFFVVRDPFNAFDPAVAPFIMPFLNIALFFTVQMLTLCLFIGASSLYKRKRAG